MSTEIYRVIAGWPHVMLFAHSGVQDLDPEHLCFVRSGHDIYFASDSPGAIALVKDNFDLERIDDLPPHMSVQKPFEIYGELPEGVGTTIEGP